MNEVTKNKAQEAHLGFRYFAMMAELKKPKIFELTNETLNVFRNARIIDNGKRYVHMELVC